MSLDYGRLTRGLGTALMFIIADYFIVLTDCITAGRVLGEMQLAAMNLLMPVFSIVTFVTWLMASGSAAAYSWTLAKRNERKAAEVAGQGMLSALVVSVVLAAAFNGLEGAYLAFMAPSDEVTVYSGQFWRWYRYLIPIQGVYTMLVYLAFVRGFEVACVRSYALTVMTNVIASYLLCQRMDVAGIAVGSLIALSAGLLALLPRALLAKPAVAMKLGFDRDAFLVSLTSSLSDAFIWLFHAVLFFAIVKYVLWFWDSESLAVCAVVFCIIRLTGFFGGIGISLRLTAARLRGKNVMDDRAARLARVGAIVAFAVMVNVTVVFCLAPELLNGVFGISSADLAVGAKRAARITAVMMAVAGTVSLFAFRSRVRKSKYPQAPLNYLQNYVMSRMTGDDGSQMFNLAKLFRVRKGVDIRKLAASLAASGRSHEAMLTVLHKGAAGDVFQSLELSPSVVEVPIVKMSEDELFANKSSLVKSFRMFGGCLFEAKIFDCGENAYLLSNFHHLICDGYSFPLILADAHRAWDGETLTTDGYYATLVRRDERSLSAVAKAKMDFLRELIKARSFTTLPAADFDGDAGYGVLEVPLTLPADFAARMTAYRATRHHMFLAATVMALHRLTGANDLLIDWVFHGRTTKEELKTVGAFMVDLPFIVEGMSEKTAADVIAHVKQETFSGIKSSSAVRDVSDLNPTGQDRLTFIYQDEWGELMTPGPVREDGPYAWMIEETIPLSAPAAATENPFNVEIMEHRDSTRLFLEYDTGRYSESTVRRYADLFRESLDWIVQG